MKKKQQPGPEDYLHISANVGEMVVIFWGIGQVTNTKRKTTQTNKQTKP
jgi:hypothetical protein